MIELVVSIVGTFAFIAAVILVFVIVTVIFDDFY